MSKPSVLALILVSGPIAEATAIKAARNKTVFMMMRIFKTLLVCYQNLIYMIFEFSGKLIYNFKLYLSREMINSRKCLLLCEKFISYSFDKCTAGILITFNHSCQLFLNFTFLKLEEVSQINVSRQ